MKVLETDRLTLRHQTAGDAAFILKLMNDPSWIQNIGDKGLKTIEDAQKYILNGAVDMYSRLGYGLFLVELKDSGTAIGICGLVKRDFLEDADLGFALLPEFWGKGYAHEASIAVLGYAKSALKFNRIAAFTSEDNEASAQLLVKLGFQYKELIPYPGTDEKVRLYEIEV